MGPYGLGPIWAYRALMGPKGPYGPIGPLWAHMGPILLNKSSLLGWVSYTPFFIDKKVAKLSLSQEFLNYFVKKILILMKNHKINNKNINIVSLEILKVKTWFGDKDL